MKILIALMLLSVAVTGEETKDLPQVVPADCAVKIIYSHFTFGQRCWRDEVMVGMSFQPGFEGVYCAKISVQCVKGNINEKVSP